VTYRMGSGSGNLTVTSFERGDQCGSNGVKTAVSVAVLTEIWQLQCGSVAVSICGSGSVNATVAVCQCDKWQWQCVNVSM
jgi:hypothetical protein